MDEMLRRCQRAEAHYEKALIKRGEAVQAAIASGNTYRAVRDAMGLRSMSLVVNLAKYGGRRPRSD